MEKWKSFIQGPTFRISASYAFSTWAERSWTFTISLALYQVGTNLQLPAISDLVNCLAVLLFGAYIGSAIDKTPRLTASRVSLFANNATVILSAIALVGLFQWQSQLPNWSVQLLTAVSVLLCAASVLAQTAIKIVLTRDWIVVICHGDQAQLASMNSWLLTIDLTASILSPLIVGQVITYVSMEIGCVFVAVWSLASFGIEYYLLWLVYAAEPDLAVKKSKQPIAGDSKDADEATPLMLPEGGSEGPEETSWKAHFLSLVSGWHLYYKQSVFPAGLALALLFLTVLGFDGITNSYVVSQGIQSNVLAAMRGIGAITGISGSLAFPLIRARIGLPRTGLFSLGAEIACLALSVGSIWMAGSPFNPFGYFNHSNSSSSTLNQTLDVEIANSNSQSLVSVWVFVIGVVLARFGLYMADLTILQTMQEHVKEEERGVIFGVQNALNQFMSLIKDIIVIFLPDPETFGIPIIVSFAAVCSGFLAFAYYSRKVRGHILPFHNCWSGKEKPPPIDAS